MSDRARDNLLLLPFLASAVTLLVVPDPTAGSFNPLAAAAVVALVMVGVGHVVKAPRQTDVTGVWDGEIAVPEGVPEVAFPTPLTLDLYADGGRRIFHEARLSGTVRIGSVTLPVSPESMVVGWLVCDEIVVVAEDREAEASGEPRSVAVRGRFSGDHMSGSLWSWTAERWVSFGAERVEER